MAEVNAQAENGKVLVGVKTNPDGSLDKSRAAHWIGNDGKGLRQLDERVRQARARKFEIPKEVQKGTANYVWYELRNAIWVNEELPRQPGNEEIQKRIHGMRIEQGLIEQMIMPAGDLSSAAALKTLEDYIESWKQKNAQKPDVPIYIGGVSMSAYPLVDVMAAAGRLKGRLSGGTTETPRTEGKPKDASQKQNPQGVAAKTTETFATQEKGTHGDQMENLTMEKLQERYEKAGDEFARVNGVHGKASLEDETYRNMLIEWGRVGERLKLDPDNVKLSNEWDSLLKRLFQARKAFDLDPRNKTIVNNLKKAGEALGQAGRDMRAAKNP